MNFEYMIEHELTIPQDCCMIEPNVHTKKIVMNTGFAERLATALARAGVKDRGAGVWLHRLTGVTPKAASKWINGESVPRREKLTLIAQQTGVRSEWLEYGIEPMLPRTLSEAQQRHSKGVSPASTGNVVSAFFKDAKKFPVISWVQAGDWSEAIDVFQPGYADNWETSDCSASDSSFWLKVVGDSMTAPTGVSIPEGHLILVDPEVLPENGSLVVAKLTDSQEVTFKKLVIDAGQRYLKPLNPNYRIIEINGNCRIVGVVREAKIKF